jgi:predicted enzyme related to lactoylglutathione lyase
MRFAGRRKQMTKPNMILLYVADPTKSVDFYAGILNAAPLEQSPTFAMFQMNEATVLGLWGKQGVEPKVTAGAGATELGVHVESRAAVDATHADWKNRKVPIAQAPTEMDFGYTFVGLDPDGHRLRVFSPEAP